MAQYGANLPKLLDSITWRGRPWFPTVCRWVFQPFITSSLNNTLSAQWVTSWIVQHIEIVADCILCIFLMLKDVLFMMIRALYHALKQVFSVVKVALCITRNSCYFMVAANHFVCNLPNYSAVWAPRVTNHPNLAFFLTDGKRSQEDKIE